MNTLKQTLQNGKDQGLNHVFIPTDDVSEKDIKEFTDSLGEGFRKGIMVYMDNNLSSGEIIDLTQSPSKKQKTEDDEVEKILSKLRHIQTEIHGLKYHTVGELERKKKHLIGELHSKYDKDICHNCIKRGKIILTTYGVYCEDCNRGMRTGWEF